MKSIEQMTETEAEHNLRLVCEIAQLEVLKTGKTYSEKLPGFYDITGEEKPKRIIVTILVVD